jgi:hypothetical protein
MADIKKNKVLHKRSNVEGKMPEGNILDYGEIAINYNANEPFLSIKVSGSTDGTEYVKFSSDDVIFNEIIENEKITAAALTSLSDNKQDKLVSGTSIKTINNTEILGEGNIEITTATSEDIPIIGGPLASAALEIYPDGTVPSGTTFQDLFLSLFCQEIYPSVENGLLSVVNSKYSISIVKPSISADYNSGSLMEIGDNVTINEVVANSVSLSITKPSISGFKNGYSESLTGQIIQTNSISEDWTTDPKDGEVYKLSVSKSKFSGSLPVSTVSASTASECKLPSCTLTVTEGENKYTVTESAPKYVGSHNKISSKYIVSNLGKRNEKNKTPEIAAKSNIEATATSVSNTFTITGVYPIFTNGEECDIDSKKAGEQSALLTPKGQSKFRLINANDDVTIAISFAGHAQAGYTLWIPNGWTLKKAWRLNGVNNEWVTTEDTALFVNNGNEDITIHGNSVQYTKYVWKADEGANKVKFIIGK